MSSVRERHIVDSLEEEQISHLYHDKFDLAMTALSAFPNQENLNTAVKLYNKLVEFELPHLGKQATIESKVTKDKLETWGAMIKAKKEALQAEKNKPKKDK